MTLLKLHNKLKVAGIATNMYYLHGLYGSTDDNEKLALTIKTSDFSIQYKIYFKERGKEYLIKEFYCEREACEYFYKKMLEEEHINSRFRKPDEK